MCNAEYLLNPLALEKLVDVVHHVLVGESSQAGWVVGTTTAEQVWHDQSIPPTREIIDLVPPVKRRGGIAVKKQQIGLVGSARFREGIAVRYARGELSAPYQAYVAGVEDVGLDQVNLRAIVRQKDLNNLTVSGFRSIWHVEEGCV